ncbi:MAG TPA: hypothetical protein VHU41_03390 [Thermoanaerobaculia bacterium]|nr:hypothetical protein [Thermoanaerobaculia bacterium]
MIRLRLLNIDGFEAAMRKSAAAVIAGIHDGVETSVQQVAAGIASATPVKSGKARSSVFFEMLSAVSGQAGYNLEEAWYMNVVVFGARPHPILARGLRGSRAARAAGKHARKHAYGKDFEHVYDKVFWSGAALNVGSGNGARALALAIGGGGAILRKMVKHPGIKKDGIPAKTLDAQTDQIVENVSDALEKRIGEVS